MSTHSLNAITVLVVDDVKLFRAGLRALLEEHGVARVVEAIDGDSAVYLYGVHKPDIVLMDIGLPGTNGIDATAHIRESNPDAKIIMLTSHNTSAEVLKAFSSGANAYCLKDIDDRIVDIIQTVLDGSVWIDGAVAGAVLSQLQQLPQAAMAAEGETQDGLPDNLTERDVQILEMIADGRNNPEIADALNVSVHTVRVYVSNIFEKLEVQDRTQAAVKSIRLGYI